MDFMGMMGGNAKEIRIGIIGCGMISEQHAGAYKKIPGVKIVAACDIIEAKVKSYCHRHGIENEYVDFREMLKRDDLDAIDVCVHNNLHTPLATAVLRAGFNCYCEKPMAGAYIDAVTLHKEAEKSGKMLHIQLGRLYSPQAHAARKFIDGGRMGHIYHARSYGYRRRMRPFVDGFGSKEFNSTEWAGHGALFDMGVYHISLMLYLLGNPKIERVAGHVYQEIDMLEERRKESGFDVEELGVGMVFFENKLTMDIIESWAIHAGQFPASMIVGSKGGLSIEPLTSAAPGIMSRIPDSAFTFYGEELGYPTTVKLDLSTEEGRIAFSNPDRRHFNDTQGHWISALRGDCELIPTKDIALSTMEVSEGIYLSSIYNREVTSDEILSLSKSTAKRSQETPFGILQYDF